MNISRLSPRLLSLLLPLASAGFTAPLAAQDEVPLPEADTAPIEAAPPEADTPPAEAAPPEVVSPPPPAAEEPVSPAPSATDSQDAGTEAIPQEIQDEADGVAPRDDVTGPRVDDTYNSLDNSGESIFSQIYVGPTIQIGFPQPLSYGLEALVARSVSFGFGTGDYTVDQIDKAEIKLKGWDVHVRWHPWLSAFFVGAAYGHMDVDGTFEDTFTARVNGFEREVDASVKATIKTNFIAPKVGWFAVWESGLTFGFEVGAQIPLGPDTHIDATLPGTTAAEEAQIKATDDYKDIKDQADQTVKVLGKRTVPVVTLLKVGWLF